MSKSQNNIFTIACDMDDVLMVPHTYIEFSKYLGIHEQFSVPLIEYKSGLRSYESLLDNWYNTLTGFSTSDRTAAIKHVANTISEKAYQFVEISKKLGRFIIVSNNDGDMVRFIAQNFNVKCVAVNKYIFELRLVTQRKSEALKQKKINVDVAITDDPVNEKDFLDLSAETKSSPSCGIVLRRNDMPADYYDTRYKTVNTLEEAYQDLILIKKELR